MFTNTYGNSVEFVVRDCGRVGFLPIIRAIGRELYRGEHHKAVGTEPGAEIRAAQAAWDALTEVWETEATSKIKEFKNPPPFCFEDCDPRAEA